MTLASGSHLGPYEILDLLGAGGMGQVYRARDPRLGRQVAIKVLPDEITDPDRLRRFETEARAIGGLNHPNILTIYDIGTHEDRPFLVSELLEGETLRQRSAGSPLPVDTAVDYTLQIARGLAAAHDKGVVHRDIKPENLFVTEEGTIKILDFGLAKLLQPEGGIDSMAETFTAALPTQPGLVLGTIGYLSPEQARGTDVDERSDLFSLGAVLYEMLTGKRPFAGDTPADIISAILTKEPAEIPSSDLDVPAALENLVRRCLEKDPAARISSARNVAEALMNETAPIEGTSQSRSALRRPAVLLGTAIMAVILVLLVIFGIGREPDERTGDGDALGAQATIDSIAVLPLDNLSGDPEQDYFAAGMTDALIADLSRIGGFKVISRTSVMRYKETEKSVPEIAAELGVEAVVEGSVSRSGNSVRIIAQLIEAATDHHLWAQTFEREIEDVLSLQGEVAREIAKGIGGNLGAQVESPAEKRRVDPQAYDAFLRAEALGQELHLESDRVIKAYDRAIELDPTFAPSYASLSEFYAYLALIGEMPPGDGYLQSQRLARQAIELDPGLPKAHVALARVHFQYEWDWPAAEAEFERALELDPENPYTLDLYGAYRVLIHADCDGGLSSLQAARLRDPFDLGTYFDLGVYSFHCRRWDESIAALTRATELSPAFYRSRMILAWNYSMKNMHEEAVKQCDEVAEEMGELYDPTLLCTCAWVYSRAGSNFDTAHLRLVDRLNNPPDGGRPNPAFMGFALAEKDIDGAIEHMQEALRERSSNLIFLRVAPGLDPLRDDPRFQEIVKQMNFPG